MAFPRNIVYPFKSLTIDGRLWELQGVPNDFEVLEVVVSFKLTYLNRLDQWHFALIGG